MASHIKYGKNTCMNWIYLSPHFDDVALSCGGLVWELSHARDDVSVWTIFGGKPTQVVNSPIIQELHARWQSGDQAIHIRKSEDIRSCRILNAAHRHFDFPDCIYRVDDHGNPLYSSEDSLFGPVNDHDLAIVNKLVKRLDPLIPASTQIVCPLAIGNHVDHQLTRQIVAKLERTAWFYVDFPYILKHPEDIATYVEKDWLQRIFPISENGFQKWLKSVSAHRSQLSTFWEDAQEMEGDFRNYLQIHQGIPLWHPCHNP